MNIMLALIMALGLFFPVAAAPAPAPLTAPVTATVAPVTAPAKATAPAPVTVHTTSTGTAQCEEDMPCWNCSQMGNTICGPTPILAKEAWEAFSTDGFTYEELAQAFSATYRGTTTNTKALPDGHEWYVIQSTIQPKLHHVFELEFGTTR